MTILGLSTFCDSSAAIVRNGKIISAVEEERLNRQKHYDGMPWLSIEENLNIAGISIEDINMITIGWNPLLGWVTRISETVKSLIRVPEVYNAKVSRGGGYLNGCKEIFKLRKSLADRFSKNGVNQKIIYVNHHLAHAASTFFSSPYETANIIVADGIGERSSLSFFKGEGNEIKRITEIKFPHSLGHLYASVTGFLGFKMTCDEGKVMALASFGEDEYADLFSKLVQINEEKKTIRVNTKILDYHAARKGIFSNEWIRLTGISPRKKSEPLIQEHKNLSHSLQKRLEECVFAFLEMYFPMDNGKPLCAAGGVFLNSVLNGKIVNGYEDKFFIQPAAGDNGVSAGAALYCSAKHDKEFKRNILQNVYLGREFKKRDIEIAMEKHCVKCCKSNNIFRDAAEFIVQGNIVGWFSGRMEFGPRALGNRSILASPESKEIKDILNSKVKHREEFRPFACSVIREDVKKYFKNAQESPFMLKVFDFKEEYKDKFLAISHVDFSCRIQTVSKQQNPDFYKLLEEIKKITGYGLVLNTSMNIAGEPIIDTPEEAIELIKKTDLDILIMNDYIIKKKNLLY